VKLKLILITAFLSALAGGSAIAHHSFATFDQTKETTQVRWWSGPSKAAAPMD
jgi:hypothetical protein